MHVAHVAMRWQRPLGVDPLSALDQVFEMLR
jgi:hypothetical protein